MLNNMDGLDVRKNCVFFSVKSNVKTTCPTAPIFSPELRLGPAGLWNIKHSQKMAGVCGLLAEDESCPWLVFHRGHIVNVIRLTNAYLISTGQFNIIDQKTRNINQMSVRNSFTEMFKLNIFWFCRRLLLGPVTMRILVPVMFVCASLILWREREHLQWSRSV